MPAYTINGISVKFPFEPYELQKNYMAKVIECLQKENHGLLESPTGTGKTLSLLCASLAWLETKKAQLQAQYQTSLLAGKNEGFTKELQEELLDVAGGKATRSAFVQVPQIIYSSRTHTQLSQAMQELKRTEYNYMIASALGSREQMCIHPDVIKEENNNAKIQVCRGKVQVRACHFQNRIESQLDNPSFKQNSVVDIEDLVKLGKAHSFCPYYMAKEIKKRADIIFTPYNYLLDPKLRQALGIELSNTVVILDEAHNVEKMCEDSASLQIKSTDVALAIEEVTDTMKLMTNFNDELGGMPDVRVDFSAEELCNLKEFFLNFEKALDAIELKTTSEGTTFDGNFIFKLLGDAGINDGNFASVLGLIDKIIQFISTNSNIFSKKSHGLHLFEDLLKIAFNDVSPTFKEKIQKSYKVHIIIDGKQPKNNQSTWMTKNSSKTACRVLSYWCFSPGFGMNMLTKQGVKTVILTSGTLAPLKPLITELEIDVRVCLENPHIVTNDQVYVKILSKGPDGATLNGGYKNRDNLEYIQSLGMTISNFIRIIPNGVLIFFPSYPMMNKFAETWQNSGLWNSINDRKPIFMEPKTKAPFQDAMNEYYRCLNDEKLKGAIFMGVCRGKIAEGLDFADAYGRAVLIVGLPYPPLLDPRIVLKKRYLDTCRSKNKDYISGHDWYNLEATKAVNQAIGRVIRHKNDYGAILLLDARFNNPYIINQMSRWLRDRIENKHFRDIVREMNAFFKNAEINFPLKLKPIAEKPESCAFEMSENYKCGSTKGNFEFSSSSISTLPERTEKENLVKIHKRTPNELEHPSKRKKIILIPNPTVSRSKDDISDVLKMVKSFMKGNDFKEFIEALKNYKTEGNFKQFTVYLDDIFVQKYNMRQSVLALKPYIKNEHSSEFDKYWTLIA